MLAVNQIESHFHVHKTFLFTRFKWIMILFMIESTMAYSILSFYLNIFSAKLPHPSFFSIAKRRTLTRCQSKEREFIHIKKVENLWSYKIYSWYTLIKSCFFTYNFLCRINGNRFYENNNVTDMKHNAIPINCHYNSVLNCFTHHLLKFWP